MTAARREPILAVAQRADENIADVTRVARALGYAFDGMTLYLPPIRLEHVIEQTGATEIMARKIVAALGWKVGRDGSLHHRPRGEAHPSAKLTEAAVREIRAGLAQGVSLAELGRRYGVRPKTIRGVRDGLTWRHVI